MTKSTDRVNEALPGVKLPPLGVGNPAFDGILGPAFNRALRGLGDVTHSELAYKASEWLGPTKTITEADVAGIIAAVIARCGTSVTPASIEEICADVRSNIGAPIAALATIRGEALANADKAVAEAASASVGGGDAPGSLMAKLAAADKLIAETFAKHAQYLTAEERERIRRLTELRDQHPRGSEAWLDIERQRLEAAGEVAGQGAGRARGAGNEPAARDLSAAEKAAREARVQIQRTTHRETQPSRSPEGASQLPTLGGETKVTLAESTASNDGLPSMPAGQKTSVALD